MEWSAIVTFVFQTVITVLIGAVGWGIKNAINELKDKAKKNEASITELNEKFNDLKADLPLVYVLREDFIRVLNNVDMKLDKLLGNNTNTKEG